MTVAVAFDFEDVLPTVLRAHSKANRDDAEEAVQVAVAELLEVGTPLTPPNVVTRARSRLINALRRHERRNSSLDAFRESDEDQAGIELAIEEVDFEAHLRLDEDPIIAERRERVERGYTPRLEGWTPEKVTSAFKRWAARHGRPPGFQDLDRDPALPGKQATLRQFPTFNVALEAAGLPTRRPGSPKKWTRETADAAFAAFVQLHGRAPKSAEVSNCLDHGLPNWNACKRIYGHTRLAEIATCAILNQ